MRKAQRGGASEVAENISGQKWGVSRQNRRASGQKHKGIWAKQKDGIWEK